MLKNNQKTTKRKKKDKKKIKFKKKEEEKMRSEEKIKSYFIHFFQHFCLSNILKF